jgi:hypothetical protein
MNSASIRVALYARVSTAKCEKCGKIRAEHDNHDHDFKGQDPEVQLRELREYVERRGWEIADVYTDVGVSGAKASRPDLNRLMTDAGRRTISRSLGPTSHTISMLWWFRNLQLGARLELWSFWTTKGSSLPRLSVRVGCLGRGHLTLQPRN